MKKTICLLLPFLFAFIFTANVHAANWGLHFPKDGERPIGNATAEYLAPFDAYFIGSSDEKVLYLTFDAGYENGYTADILDTLATHKVPAAFFLVGHYYKTSPELVKRMAAEGHIVGNHTMSHPDMSKISDKETFSKELALVEELYKSITGKEISKFYRPPQGTFSESNLKMAKELGYKTVFWSTAYKDWIDDAQPSKEEAFSKLLPRTHPGAVILLHNTSKTNAVILDELIKRYKDMGYRFESLEHLVSI